MRKDVRVFSLAIASCGIIAALFTGPKVAAEPFGLDPPLLPANCLPGTYGQTVYCDEDMNADGSWVRCWDPKPEDMTVQGAQSVDVPPTAKECRLVRPNSVPAWSPPYHIGYGGEGVGQS